MEKIYTTILRLFKLSTRMQSAILSYVLFFAFSVQVYAEGTAQLTPTLASDNQGVIQIWDNNDVNRNSSTFGCPATKRLYFTICNPEQVYFGMNFDTGDLTGTSTLWYRIISPSNIVVFPVSGTGWQQVTNAGAGSIASWAAANAGPNTIAGGAGGYTPLSFTPAEAGDFYIELYRKSNAGMPTAANTPVTGITAAQIALQQRTKTRLRYFDLTVATGPTITDTRIPGRLFSQTWDINVNAANNQFIATMYVYSDDGIVTGLNFNGIRPFGFTISCNPTGVANTGNTAVDRRSIAANSTYAQYKIFLHDPDNNCYSTGIFGSVLNANAITVTGCDVNNRCINIVVDKAGGAELLLNFDGIAGYQFGGKDVLIKQTLVVGSNCIPWNSRDGLGNLITPGTALDMRLDYFNGLTHLPLFDVENHPYGFIVSLVRPAGPPPLLFWDDTALSGGTSNLAGCTTGTPTPTTGCHGFGSVLSGPVPASSQPTTTDWGNNVTINTWWYANYINVSAVYNVPGSIAVDANSTVAGTGSTNDINSCTNAGPISLNGLVTGATGGTWSVKPGVTGTFANANSPVTTFTPSTSDLSKPSIYLYLTSTGNGSCPSVKDSMKITFIGGPTVSAGSPQSACANNSTLTLNGNFTVAPGIIWSGGAGSFVPNNTTKNATYTPTAGEISSGTVKLVIKTTGSVLCPEAKDSVLLTYTPAPTVSAGSPVTVCANNSAVALTGTATNQTGVTWSGGTGTFTTPGNLSTTYNPSGTETNITTAKTVTLTLTASKAGCNSVTSNVNVTINPPPIVSAGADQTICKNDSVNLAGTVTNAAGGTWTGGTGKFTPNANTLTANYKPSAAELSGSSVILTLTSTGNGLCNAVPKQMKINFTAAPTAVITGPSSVCANNAAISLSSTITQATGQKWIGSGGSFVANTSAPSVTYTPTAGEISSGFTGIVLQTTGGSCPPTADTIIISFIPAPTVSGGSPISICSNNPTGSLIGTVTGVATVTWSSPTGGLFSAPTNPKTNYTATATDITNGSVTLTVTANKATCNPVSSTVVVTVTPAPTVTAGPSRTVCANNPTATFNGSVTGPAGIGVLWTGGDGTFGSPTSVNTTYTAGPNDLIAGTVTLTITTTGNGNCSPVSATTTMTITAKPTVTAGSYSVCSNNAAVSLNGAVTVATGGQWVGGAGSFSPSRNILNPTYTPTAGEISAGSLNLTLQSTGNGNCNVVSAIAPITFTPAPTVTPATPVNVCADAPTATITTTKTLATGVLWSGGSGGTIASPTALSTTYTPTLAEISAGTVTLTVTTTGNGTCSAVASTLTILIAPAPTANAGSNQIVCGTVSTVSTLTGTVTGATGGTWTKVSGTGSIANANSLSTTYTPSALDIVNGSVTLKLTTTGNGLCQPVSSTMTITYTPEPSINAGANQIVCSTELPITLSATGSPAQWNTSGGSFGNVNSLNTTYTPSAGEVSAGTVTLSISTTPSGACPIKTSSITITIPAGPIVNPGAATQTMCGSLTSYQLNGVVTNATGGIWTTNGTGSFLPNANTLNATYTPSTTDRTNGSVILTLTSTGNGLCKQVSNQTTLMITPAITVSAGPNQTLCADVSGIPLKGAVSVASGGIWSITSGNGSITSPTSLITTYTPTLSDITTGSVSLLLTSTGNGGCPAVTSPVTFTLTPAPTLTQGPNQTICGDSAFVQLNASITVATGILWTSNGTGSFAPNNVTLNAKYIPSAADVTAGTVILTAQTTGNGTCNPITKSLTVTITPVVTLNQGSNQTVCENNSTVNLNAVITTASAVNWTTNGTGSFASQTSPTTTYTPSAADISSGLVTLTVSTTGNGTCKTKTGKVQVTIVPSPIVDAGLPQTLCANTSSISLNGSVIHATGGTWTSNGTGSFANPNSVVTTYTPTSADTTAGSVTFTLTSTGNGSCNAVSKSVIVTFQKMPVVHAGPSQTICADSSYVQLAGSVTNAGGGVWSKSGTGVFFPSTITLNAAYTTTSADRTAGSVILTLTSTSNGVCPAVSDHLTVTITPAPIVTVSSSKTVCANNDVTTVSGTFSVASGIKWTTSGTGTFSPNNTTTTVTYTPSAIDVSAGSVVLAMTTTGNGSCKPGQGFLTLTITPAPTIDAGNNKTICGDSLGVLLNQATVSTATGVQWSSNGSGTFGPNSTTVQPTYFPSAADKSAGKVKLTVVSTGNGNCLAVSDTITINIKPIPTVNAGSDISVCADTNGVKLAGTFTIAGGVQWQTSGSGSFVPSISSPTAEYVPSSADTTARNITLTLTTTNNGTCKAVSSQTHLSIAPVPVVSAGTNRTVCADVDQLILNGSVVNATGGIWTTNGSGTFSPSNTALMPDYTPSASDLSTGTVIFTLSSTGNGFCHAVSQNATINFNPVATISAGNDLQICNSVTTVSLNASATNVSNVTWTILSGNGTIGSPNSLSTTYNVAPADVTAGSVTLRITGSALSGCSNVSNDVTITFVAAPPINAGPNKTVCSTDLPIQLQGTGSSAQWSGYAGTFNPNNQTLNALYMPSAGEITAGTVTLTLTTINNGVCTAATSNVTFTILPGPVVDAGTITTICANTPTVNLTGTTNGVSSTGVTWSTGGSGTFTNGNTLTPTYTPSASDKNGGEVILTITSTGNNAACKAAIDTLHLFISPAPKVSTGASQTVCGDVTSVDVNSAFSNASGVQWSTVTANGTFASSTSAQTQYTVSNPADTTAGTITIQVATTGQNAGCSPATAQMSITFSKPPTVSAGSPITVCADTSSVPLKGVVTVASGGIWSSASGGTFTPDASSLTPSYVPSASDVSSGTAVLTLTTTGNGTCNTYTSNVTITLNKKPTITGSVPNDSICSGNTISANANFTNSSSLAWVTTGTGSFSTATGNSTVYTPSASDVSNGGVIIYATTVGSNPCKEIQKYFSITILQSPASLVNAGFDETACADAGFFPLNGTVGGITGTGIWTSSTGRGDFYPDATDLTPIFVPDQADINAGGLTIRLTSTNNGICAPNFDDMVLTIKPAPTVSAGTPFPPLCADTAFIQFNPTITNALGGIWSTTGTGTFSPSVVDLNAVYVPSAADRKKGSIGFTLTTTGNGTCNSYSDFLTIKLTPKPTLNLGSDKTVCADNLVDLNAVVTVATGVNWSASGSGVFTVPTNTISTEYIFSDADTTSGVVNIFGTTVNQGLCKPVSDTLKVTIQPVPVVIASSDQAICADTNFVVVSAKIGNAAGLSWTTSGSGSFTPNSTVNPVQYNLSGGDLSKGSVRLYATSANSGVCSARIDSVDVSIAPVPIVSAGSPILCDTLAGANLTGTITTSLAPGAATWSSSSGAGIFSVNNSTLNATYIPNRVDIAAGKVTLTLTASGYGTCKPVTSSAVLLIEPLPIANAGQDQFSCINNTVTVSAQNTQPGIQYSWKDNTGAVVAPANSTSTSFVVTASTYRVLLAENYKHCVVTDTVNINTFTLPSFTLTPNPACYQDNLMVKSNPSPQPIVPGLYQWFRNGSIMTGQDKTFVIVPDTGTYKIVYAYGNCSSNDQITVQPVPTLKASDVTACGSATLTASVNPASAVINWSLNGAPKGTGTTINITSVANDTIKYQLKATNPTTGCSNTDSVYVIGLPKPQMVSIDTTSCVGLKVKLTARPSNIPYINQLLQVTYNWQKNQGTSFSTDSVVFVTSVGQYKGAISIDQCKDTSTNNINFAPYPVSNLNDSYKYCYDTSPQGVPLDPGSQKNVTYLWSTGQVTQTISPRPEDDSTYKVSVTNQYLCTTVDSTRIHVICAPRIYVPTAFTPDIAGSGDQLFTAYGKYEINYKMMVFNRWGEVIFVSTDKQFKWNGIYLGEPAPSGVYPWIVTYEGKEEFKGPYKQTGSVTLIR
jgi:gliding motility-associated-like protein